MTATFGIVSTLIDEHSVTLGILVTEVAPQSRGNHNGRAIVVLPHFGCRSLRGKEHYRSFGFCCGREMSSNPDIAPAAAQTLGTH